MVAIRVDESESSGTTDLVAQNQTNAAEEQRRAEEQRQQAELDRLKAMADSLRPPVDDTVNKAHVASAAALIQTKVRNDGLTAEAPTPGVLSGLKGMSSAFQADSTSSTANDGPTNIPQYGLNVVPIDQGNTNGCGTTSLAMVMNYYGQQVSREQIDKDIRQGDVFTSADNILSWAAGHGMRAEMKNEASLEDLASMIDQGVPVITLIEPSDPNDLNLHYEVVTGYTRGPDGKISDISIRADDFMKCWSNIRLKGVGTGYNRLMIAMVPKGDRPIVGADGKSRPASQVELPKSSFWADLRQMPASNLGDGIADVVNGWKNGNAGDLVGGAIKTVGGVVSGLIASVPIPGFQELGGAVGKVVEWVAKPVEVVLNAASTVVKKVGRFLKHLFG